MGPIGSAVLTFIGYKQTDRQTDKPNLYIDRSYKEGRPYFKKHICNNIIISEKRELTDPILGYGNMVPRTDWGKIATIIYAIIGNISCFNYS